MHKNKYSSIILGTQLYKYAICDINNTKKIEKSIVEFSYAIEVVGINSN